MSRVSPYDYVGDKLGAQRDHARLLEVGRQKPQDRHVRAAAETDEAWIFHYCPDGKAENKQLPRNFKGVSDLALEKLPVWLHTLGVTQRSTRRATRAHSSPTTPTGTKTRTPARPRRKLRVDCGSNGAAGGEARAENMTATTLCEVRRLGDREEMAAAQDLGDYFGVIPDLRDLNYSKFMDQGQTKVSTTVEYNSHNSRRLDVNEMRDLLMKLN